VTGWISHSSTYGQIHVDFYGYVPSCQAPKAAASRGLEWEMLICLRETPGNA
jgi:hypothetical protein